MGELCPIPRIVDSSVAKTDATTSRIDEEKREEPTLRVMKRVPSAVQAEVAMEVAVEPFDERTATVILNLPPLEQMWSMRSEEVPQSKTSEEIVKDLTLNEEILEQVVAQVEETVVDIPKVPSPPTEKEVRPEAGKKVVKEESRGSIVSSSDFLQYSVTSLLKYLDK